MKNSLRVLTWVTLACGCAVATYLVAEPAMERWRAESASKPDQGQASANNLARALATNLKVDPAGGKQLLSAIARLEQRGSVTSRIRQQADVGEFPFFGAGTYRQQGRGTKRQVRWLLQSQRDGVPTTLLQISDGRFLWTDRNLASGRHIDRVDLWQLRRQARTEPRSYGTADEERTFSAPFSPFLGSSFGGLPMLLESLSEHFEFTAPRPFRFGQQQVIALVGRWRPEALAAILTDTSELSDEQLTAATLRQQLESHFAEHELPGRMPHHVLVLLGQQDLFPYLIDYRAASDALADPGLPEKSLYQLSSKPLARLEFYDVQFDERIDTSEFIYTPPPEPEWLDSTATYLRRLNRLQHVQLALQREARMANATKTDSR